MLKRLTEEQIRFFDTFGYLILKEWFKPEICRITASFEQTFARYSDEVIHWQHRAHEFGRRDFLTHFIDRDPYLSSLIDDPRINCLFEDLLGEDYCYRGSDGNYFQTNTRWHSDTFGAILSDRNIKLAFYLEPLTEKDGALRVLPGSHLFGDRFANKIQSFLTKDDCLIAALGLHDAEVPCQVLACEPGDVIVFDFRLKHASCSVESKLRRMFTICASEKIKEQDFPRFKSIVENSGKMGITHFYGEQMLAGASAERMRHLQQCLQFESLLTNKTNKESNT